MAVDLSRWKLSMVVDGGPGLEVRVMDGSISEWIVLLRFVDIMSSLEPDAMYMMEAITWRQDEVELRMGVLADFGGQPLSLDCAERISKRMAKVLWNLGGPPHVWFSDELENYRFDWVKDQELAK